MIGHQIRKLREDRKIKRNDLADRLNIDESTLGKIENNQIKVSADRLLEIAKILEVPINDFFASMPSVNFNNNHINIAYINQFIEAQKENTEQQNKFIEELISQNKILTDKIDFLVAKIK